MFHRTDFGGFLVCCYKAIQQLNGVEKYSVAISLMLKPKFDWTISSMFRFVVSFRLFHRASLGTRKGIILSGITWSSWLSGQYGDLRQSVEFIFHRVNEQFDESESEVRYLITHFDKVIHTLSRASSLFYVPIVSKSIAVWQMQNCTMRCKHAMLPQGVF